MKLFENLIVPFQIGLVMGICLTAILGASFGSLATIFTQDTEVLQVIRTLALVCMVLLIDLYVFVCICPCLHQIYTVICDCC